MDDQGMPTTIHGRRSPRWGLARVRGRSMLPTLSPGDRVLIGYAAKVHPGRVVVVRLPDGTIAVKRATVAMEDGWWVERDNPRQGVDSALVGVIATERVLGVVLARLWPRPRRVPARGPGRVTGAPRGPHA